MFNVFHHVDNIMEYTLFLFAFSNNNPIQIYKQVRSKVI